MTTLLGSCPTAWKVLERAGALLGKTHESQKAKPPVIQDDLEVGALTQGKQPVITVSEHWANLPCARVCFQPFRNNVPSIPHINSMTQAVFVSLTLFIEETET